MMNKLQFVEGVKRYIVEDNHETTLKVLSSPIPQNASEIDYINMINFYQQLNSKERKIIENFIKIVLDNSAASFLSVLDGISNIGQEGEFELYCKEAHNSILINEREGFLLTDYYWGTDDEF